MFKNFNPGKKALFSQVFQLAQYSLVMNASKAVSERSLVYYNGSRHILRNTKTQNRLNHTMCLNIYTERLMQVNLKEIRTIKL